MSTTAMLLPPEVEDELTFFKWCAKHNNEEFATNLLNDAHSYRYLKTTLLGRILLKLKILR